MKTYQKSIIIITLLYVLLYPVLPTYSRLNSDLIVFALMFVQLLGFIFISDERKNVFSIIKNIFKDKILFTLLLLNICMYLSALVALDARSTLTHSIRFTMYVFIFYTISYKIKAKQQKLLLNTFIGVAFLSGIYTIMQLIYTISLGYAIDKTIRMPSFLENPNNLGAYSIVAIFMALMLFINAKNKKYKIYYFSCVFVLLINVMFSQSRNALITLLVGIFVLAILYDKRLLLLSIVLPIIFFLVPTTKARIIQILDVSQNSSRLNIWEISKLMITDHPISGIGYENFSTNFPTYIANNPEIPIDPGYLAIHPHNIFLKIQTELGIWGTVIFILFIILTLVTLYKLRKLAHNNYNKLLINGVLTTFLTFGFMNLLDCYLSAPKVIASLFVVLAFANYYNVKNQKIDQ